MKEQPIDSLDGNGKNINKAQGGGIHSRGS